MASAGAALESAKVRVESDVWIPACKGNEREVYELAKVLSMDDGKKECAVKASSGPELTLPLEKVQLTNPRVVPDMTSLYHINDAGILHNLKVRSEKDLPYTMMGSVLVSVNPLHPVPDPELAAGRNMPTDVPHPYAIAENSFKNMTFSYERRVQHQRQLELMQRAGKDITEAAEIELVVNQSVVISGESGSGKTESSKRVLRHLVKRTSEVGSGESELDLQLTGVGPILESFGNASTVCNHNSSRFGKFSKLHFLQRSQERERGRAWDLVGATVETYLLEKSRVVNQSNGERNFHVFYQLINGADAEMRSKFKLPANIQEAVKFIFLKPGSRKVTSVTPETENSGAAGNRRAGGARARRRGTSGSTVSTEQRTGGMTKTMTISNEKYLEPSIIQKDKDNFAELLKALEDIGKSQEEVSLLLGAIAGVLHLGNVAFIDNKTTKDDAAMVSPETEASLNFAAQLLGLSSGDLKSLLMEKEVKAGMELITTQLDVTSAQYARDALAKWTYGIVFDWIVREINVVLTNAYKDSTPLTDLPFIGVLDIFGFESFAVNGFEQLLINYTNESLQSTFNYQVFVAEADLYKREGLILAGDPFQCPDEDGACLDLFEGEKGKPGLLMEIDSESRAPKPTDDKMNRRLHQCFQGQKSFPKPHPKDINKKFLVSHYAGIVEYTVGDFVEKNNDRIPATMNDQLKESSNNVLASAFKAHSGGSGKGFRAAKAKKTVVANFGGQIRGLVETLESTKCSFIRCVKPNPEMKWARGTNWFNNEYVNEQLKCLSIPQTAAVLKSGFPTRIDYDTIVSAYESALPADALEVWTRSNANGQKQNGRTFVSALFWAFKVPQEAYRLGLSKVFFSSGMIDLLDRIMQEATSWAADEGKESEEKVEVGRRFKLFYARLRWRRCYAKVVACNKFLKFLTISRARGNAVRIIQRGSRSFLFRNRIYKRVEKRRKAKAEAERLAKIEAEKKAKEEAKRKREESIANGTVTPKDAAATFEKSAGLAVEIKSAVDQENSDTLPPMPKNADTGLSARIRYRSGKRISGGWNLSGALRTPKGSLNPDFLDIVDMAQKNLKQDNQKLKEQNEQLQSDLESLKEDIALLKRSMPFTHILHIY